MSCAPKPSSSRYLEVKRRITEICVAHEIIPEDCEELFAVGQNASKTYIHSATTHLLALLDRDHCVAIAYIPPEHSLICTILPEKHGK